MLGVGRPANSGGRPITQRARVATNLDRACCRGALAMVERIRVYDSVGTTTGTRIWAAIGVYRSTSTDSAISSETTSE